MYMYTYTIDIWNLKKHANESLRHILFFISSFSSDFIDGV